MKENVCVTTYVWGDKYQLYIPIAAWSMKKMYPEYDIIIFLYDKLNEDLKRILVELDLYDKIVFKEYTFADCPKMNVHKAMAFRWVLWDDDFERYDYIYTIDIDMFYIKEPLSLHKQHIYHMKHITGLPFDNMRRIIPYSRISMKGKLTNMMIYVKNFGVKYLYNYLSNCRKDIFMLSGLHFVDVKGYYNVFSKDKIQYYKQQIYSGSYVRNMNTVNNENFLYLLMKELGFDVDRLAAQDFDNAPYAHTNFNNYDKELFRPTHGIHLGNYRGNFSQDKTRQILNLESELYYKNYMEKMLLNDDDFIKFLSVLPEYILIYFKRYFECAGIEWPLDN